MSKPLLDRRWPWVVAALLIVVAFLSTFVHISFGPKIDGRPEGSLDDVAALRDRKDLNVLFILIDTLRADRLGAYGYERDTSPTLDRLASTGVRFGRHLSQSSWTKASMASLWLSRYPARTGVTRFDDLIPDQAVTAAELFHRAGFLTAGIYRNGWVAPTFGFEQGFDVYMRPASRALPARMKATNPTLAERGTDEDAIGAAIEFLRIHGHKRWFLYVHLMDVHEYTYDTSSALFGGTYSDIYDNAIRWTDSVLGVFWEYLVDLGLDDKTLAVIVADHGEAFRERQLEGHARFVYKETTEIPFLLVFPFRLPEGVVVTSRTRNLDVLPTLYDLVGIPAPEGIDGRSLVPDLLAAGRGEPPPEVDRTAIAHLDQTWGQRERKPRNTVAVADGELRYVRIDGPQPSEQLFDAAVDPKELVEVSEDEPEALERLRARADAYMQTTPEWGDAPERDITDLELNQLRALGYAIP
jgi:arylsulfatase A-like enzyme